ncbi:radical SAM protein [Acidovorax sp. 22279]|uniref:radical SAM protein n=1 Tax=Acidovorax sp. 22279 TaxID=3453900 RepID=UPI003F83CC88
MPKLLAQRLKSIPHTAARSVKSFAPDLAKFITATSYELMAVKSLPAQAQGGESLILPKMSVGADDALLEVTLQLDGTRAELGRYLYSKLYYTTHPWAQFSEDAVVCFEVRERFSPQRLQIALPDAVLQAARASGCLRIRMDGLPYSQGTWQLMEMRLVSETHDTTLTQHAKRVAHRQWVREQVRISESSRRVNLPHYPESVSIELTPVCNLRCPHCSSHGMPHLHKHHNCSPEMPVENFMQLAQETFPHVSVVSLVGRGEPTLASDELWNAVTQQLREHDVRMSCVTNGTRVRQRFNASLMPWVHELIFSFDGNTAATFETNRAGAKFETVLDNLRYYHELRNTAPLSRRPQLTISWTLKRNNVAEVPDFVRRIAEFEPDLISLRHLVVFQDKERSESLLDYPEEANAALSEAYAEMDRLGIRHESPPLMMAPESKSIAVIPIRLVSPNDLKHTASDAKGMEPNTTTQQAPKAAEATAHRDESPAGSAQSQASTPPAQHDLAHALPSHTWDRETSIALREPECNWMHRTAIIMADGEVITCGKHYGEQVGHLTHKNSLWDLWNGPRMHSLRAGFGTPCMWDQCKDCWLRELKWHSQRQAKDLIAPYSLANSMDYSEAAWDYRKYSEL